MNGRPSKRTLRHRQLQCSLVLQRGGLPDHHSAIFTMRQALHVGRAWAIKEALHSENLYPE